MQTVTIRRRSSIAGIGVLVAAGLLSCTSSHSATHATVIATPARALYDKPIAIRVTGLPSGQMATVSASTTASDGKTWTDSAQFAANREGVVTTRQAPITGSYHGVNAMGIIEDEAPGGNPDTPSLFTPRFPWLIIIAVRAGGHQVGHATVTRLRPSDMGVTSTDLRPQRGGIYGEFFAPPHPSPVKRPGVPLFGGSEGGLSNSVGTQAALLAAHGYPALALAYFHEPGLSADLRNIPIEYFGTALRRLAAEPGVDARRLAVEGVSRGSEAALLTAAHYPALVAGVVAGSPTDIAMPGLPGPGAAWTWDGRPVPTLPGYDVGQVNPVGAARHALIDVAAINGPILAVCGEEDDVWPSCGYAAAMAARLEAAHSRYRPTVLAYAGAGHFVGTLTPYVPSTATQGKTASGRPTLGGGLPSADEAGRAAAWPRALAFLAHLPTH